MFLTYTLYQLRSAELRHQADQERLAREAVLARRTEHRPAAEETREAEGHSGGPRRHRFTRAA
ncbi:hypothetical protein ABZ858_27415 [Streptomyces sp. NPDC047017]|uniref:hypothetical protein n=1 Tax=Streptomyces sp. NPDC047017 TaxID=3155024 RepID=UPI0033C3C7F0